MILSVMPRPRRSPAIMHGHLIVAKYISCSGSAWMATAVEVHGARMAVDVHESEFSNLTKRVLKCFQTIGGFSNSSIGSSVLRIDVSG